MKFLYENHANVGGVYKITNTFNNRVYIGQAKTFKKRWFNYKRNLPKGKGHNQFLCNDYLKCLAEIGCDDFLVFSIVEVMLESTQKQRNEREQYYISQYWDKQNQCYNISKIVEIKDRSIFSHNPEETKRKISAATKKMWQDPEKAASIRKSMRESLNDPEVSLSKQEGLLKSWLGNEKRRNAASERMTERMANNTPETEKIIETLKLSQPKGRETFRKRIKEDAEFRQTYIDIGKKKTENLNERYKNDAEYKAMMDQKSIENIKAYNEKKIQNMPVKAPLISPDGKVYCDIRSLTAFAKEHGLDSSSLYKLYSGKLNEIKGWKFFVR